MSVQQNLIDRIKSLLDEVQSGQFGIDDDIDYDAFLDSVDNTVEDLDDIAFGD